MTMELDAVSAVLDWVLPPLLGAIIGYVTNAIAIRMLFRPLHEWRVFGVRVPLTPGIIPKQRYELAESIGRMVSRELITEDVLRKQLASPEFRQRLGQSASSLVESFSKTPFSRLREGDFAVIATSLERFIDESLYRFFNSRGFITAARALVTRVVETLGERSFSELLGRFDLSALVSERLLPMLTGPETRRKAGQALVRWVRAQRSNGAALGTLLPAELPGLLQGPLRSLLPMVLDALLRWLREDDTRHQLEIRGKYLLRDALDRMNLLQKFIITAGSFDRTLEQRMPEIVEDTLDELERAAADEQNREKIVLALVEALEGWRSRRLDEALAMDESGLQHTVENLLGLLDSERARAWLGQSAGKLLDSFADRPAREVLARNFGLQENAIVDFASFHLLSYLSKRETSRAIAAELLELVHRFLDSSSAESVGELLNLNDERREALAGFFTDRVIRVMDQRLPEFIRSFDIEKLVVDKINQLNVAEVERLLVMVIAKHLKWINLFGGLLGALIGFTQIALRLIRP